MDTAINKLEASLVNLRPGATHALEQEVGNQLEELVTDILQVGIDEHDKYEKVMSCTTLVQKALASVSLKLVQTKIIA